MPVCGRKVDVSEQDTVDTFIGYSTQYPFKVLEVVPIPNAVGWIVKTTNEDEFVVHLELTEHTAFWKISIYLGGQNRLFHG